MSYCCIHCNALYNLIAGTPPTRGGFPCTGFLKQAGEGGSYLLGSPIKYLEGTPLEAPGTNSLMGVLFLRVLD